VGKRADPAPERIIARVCWLGTHTGITYDTPTQCARAGNATCTHIAERVTYRGQFSKRDGNGGDYAHRRGDTRADADLRDEHENPRFGMRGVGEAWECLHHAPDAKHPNASSAEVPDDRRRGLHMDREEI
jgi:hypothetical protein